MEGSKMKRDTVNKTIVIMDFDGTLYRGSCPLLFHGIANADLMMALCLTNVTSFRQLTREAVSLWHLRRRTTSAYQRKILTLSEADARLTRFFVKRVLGRCTPASIDRASALVSRLCYGSVWRELAGIRNPCDFVVISKSFEFLLEQACQRASAHGVTMKISGTRVSRSDKGLYIETIMTREGKAQQVRDLLSQGAYRRAVVIGDTEDDIGMRDAAVETIGADAVVLLALNAKDKHISEAAEHSFSSWRSVGKFLRAWVKADDMQAT